jgi:hypothetical protein
MMSSDVSVETPNFHSFLENIKKHMSSWEKYSFDEITITKLDFGHSSDVYKITANPDNISIIYRIFKIRDHGYTLDKDHVKKCNFSFKMMSDLKIGPNLYEANEEFRLEEYFDSRPIKSFEINIPETRRKLAVQLGYLNSIKVTDGEYFTEKIGFFDKFFNPERLANYNRLCDLKDGNDDERVEFEKLKYLSSDQELNWVKGLMAQGNLVFSHNDIWCGNILFLKNTNDVMFIDYELVGYNFLGYDIGKLLLETVYERKDDSPEFKIILGHFPVEKDIEDFLRYYNIGYNYGKDVLDINSIDITQLENKLYSSNDEKQTKINELKKLTMIGMLLSCFYMTYTGVLVGKAITAMDFVQFAIDSHKLYLNFKIKLDEYYNIK